MDPSNPKGFRETAKHGRHIHDTRKRAHFHRDARGLRSEDTPFAEHGETDIQSGLERIGVSLSDADVSRLVRLGGSKALESIVSLGEHVVTEAEPPAPEPPKPQPEPQPQPQPQPEHRQPEFIGDDIPTAQHAGVEYGHAVEGQATRLSTRNHANDSSVVHTLMQEPEPRQQQQPAPKTNEPVQRKQQAAQRALAAAVSEAVKECRWEAAFSQKTVSTRDFKRGLAALGVQVGSGDFRRLLERVGGEGGVVDVSEVPAALGVAEEAPPGRSAAPGPLSGCGPPEDVHPRSHLPRERERLRAEAAAKRAVFERLALRHAGDPALLRQRLLRLCAQHDAQGRTSPQAFREALRAAGAGVSDGDWGVLVRDMDFAERVDVPAFVAEFAAHVNTQGAGAAPTEAEKLAMKLRRRVRDALPRRGEPALDALRAADTAGDGFVPMQDVERVFERYGVRLAAGDKALLVSATPRDAEGRVDYESLLRGLRVPAALPRANPKKRTAREARQHALRGQVFETLSRQDMGAETELRAALGGSDGGDVSRDQVREALGRVGVRMGADDFAVLADSIFERAPTVGVADVVDAFSRDVRAQVGGNPRPEGSYSPPPMPARALAEVPRQSAAGVSRHVVREKVTNLRPSTRALFRTLEDGRSSVVPLGDLRRALRDRCGLELSDAAFRDFCTDGGRLPEPPAALDYQAFARVIEAPGADSRADAFARASPAAPAPRRGRKSVAADTVSTPLGAVPAWAAQGEAALPAGGSSQHYHERRQRGHRPAAAEKSVAGELLSPGRSRAPPRVEPPPPAAPDAMGALLQDPPSSDRLCTMSADDDVRAILGASGRRRKPAGPHVAESMGGGAAATPVRVGLTAEALGGRGGKSLAQALSSAASSVGSPAPVPVPGPRGEPASLAGKRAGVTTSQRDRARHIRTYDRQGSGIFADLQYPSA